MIQEKISRIVELEETGHKDEAFSRFQKMIPEMRGQADMNLLQRHLPLFDEQIKNLKTARIAVLRTSTLEPLIPYIELMGLSYSLHLQIYLAPIYQIEQEVLDHHSELYRFKPDVIFLLEQVDDVLPNNTYGLDSDVRASQDMPYEDVQARMKNLIETIRAGCDAEIFVSNYFPNRMPLLGVGDATQSSGEFMFINEMNKRLQSGIAFMSGVSIFDFFQFGMRNGMDNLWDKRMAILAEQPLSSEMFPPFSQFFVRHISAVKNPRKKCIVLDLDNTLWGGILGEDSPDGVELGGTPRGKIFQEIQKIMLSYFQSGIWLAICSKNNEGDVLDFLEHSKKMILKKEHFAAWRINWERKDVNLMSLAEELNIGLDALVMIDDSPFECGLIRKSLPQVEVTQVPDEIADYPSMLLSLNSLERLRITNTDRKRGVEGVYQRERRELHSQCNHIEDYYRQLSMEIEISPIDEGMINRLCQLIQRTNQFNSTAIRYREQEIRRMRKEPNKKFIGISYRDKFSNVGMVGAAMVNLVDDHSAELELLLLSCRVLGRTVEHLFLSMIENWCLEHSKNILRAHYIPTRKNQQVSDFYVRCGYEEVRNSENQIVYEKMLSENHLPEWFTIINRLHLSQVPHVV